MELRAGMRQRVIPKRYEENDVGEVDSKTEVKI